MSNTTSSSSVNVMPYVIIIAVFAIIFVIAICVVCGNLSEKLHREKGYEGGFWVGFWLGLIGIVYAAGLPDKSTRNVNVKDIKAEIAELRSVVLSQEAKAQSKTSAETKKAEMDKIKCPICGTIVDKSVSVCPYCGVDFKTGIPR